MTKRSLITSKNKMPKTRAEQAKEIGKLIRERREEKKKTIAEIAHSLSLPSNQLAAIESGNLDIFPSQLATLSVLRQYANALKLNGDELALILLDSWSVTEAAVADGEENDSRGSQLEEQKLIATRSTSEIPIVNIPDKKPGNGSQLKLKQRKPPGAPIALRIMFWVTFALVMIGFLGLLLQHEKPKWFSALTRPVETPITALSNSGSQGSPPKGSLTFSKVSSTSSQATYSISTTNYTINISTSAPCWVEITGPKQSLLYAGELQAGQSTSVPGASAVSINLGAQAVTLKITSGQKTLGSLSPPAAPYTYLIESAS